MGYCFFFETNTLCVLLAKALVPRRNAIWVMGLSLTRCTQNRKAMHRWSIGMVGVLVDGICCIIGLSCKIFWNDLDFRESS